MAFNLKATFSADTKDLKKGSQEAKAAIKDFEKTSSSALEAFANVFGVNMSAVSQALNTFKGGMLSVQAAMSSASKATVSFSSVLKLLKVALVSTGIGALVVALGSLVAYFTQTQRGADQLRRFLEPLKQVFSSLRDWASRVGEAIVTLFRSPKQGWEQLKNAFKFGDLIDDTIDKVKERNALTDRQIELEKKEVAWITRKAELEEEIEKQRMISEDRMNYSAAQRHAANQKAIELTNQLYDEQKQLAQERAEIAKLDLSLSESTRDQEKEVAEIIASINLIEKERASRLKEMLTKASELTGQMKQQATEAAKIAAFEQLRAANKNNPLRVIPSADIESAISDAQTIVDIKPVISQESLDALREQHLNQLRPVLEEMSIDLSNLANEGITGFASAFGELIASLASGENGLRDFAKSIISVFASLISKVGQALVSFGTAIAVTKKFLWSNPYSAIAAGAAMVALGAALGAAVNNATNSMGNNSSMANNSALSAGSTTTLPSYMSNNSRTGGINVNVTGTLKAKGNELVAVIESENTRRKLTT